MNTLILGTDNTLAVMSLLREIVDTFEDSSARPSERIALYQKFLELRQKHNVRLAGRLLVIAGGREKHLSPMRHKSYPHTRTRLRPPPERAVFRLMT